MEVYAIFVVVLPMFLCNKEDLDIYEYGDCHSVEFRFQLINYLFIYLFICLFIYLF